MIESIHQKLERARSPRVSISYELETADAIQKMELPFVVGVMSDLSGDRATLFPSFSERKFISVDLDNFHDFLAKINPTLTLVVDNVIDPASDPLTVRLAFSHLDDFRPECITEQVEPLCTLLRSREACIEQQFSQNAVRLAEIDDLLSRQLDRILHDSEFQRLEAKWRGLHYLVLQTQTSVMLKIKVLDVSKQEMAKDLQKAVELNQSILFKKVVEDEWWDFGGEPFGALIGDYYFDHHPADVGLLEKIAHIAATAQAPFIAGAAPGLLGMDSWQELGEPRDLGKILQTPEYTAWKAAFRHSEDARYIGLTMPRILLRNPYLAPPMPTEIFVYRETIDNTDSLLWGNAAYAFASCITTAFAKYGWFANIHGYEGGGLVEGLPSYTLLSDDGEVVTKCPTEIAIADRREAELAQLGLIPLVHGKGTDSAVFFSVPSCYKPKQYDRAEATMNARLAAQLQIVFTESRFAHYLKAIYRSRRGSSLSQSDLERLFNDWISNYVLTVDEASTTMRARYPLREGRVNIREVQGKPGVYQAVVFLRPQFQLEELPVSMRLIVELGK